MTRIVLAMTALLVAMLLHSGTPIALAASLTASQNPVVIPEDVRSKQITLSWSVGAPHTKYKLVVEEQGGPVVLEKGLPAASGSEPLTVSYPKKHAVKIVDTSQVFLPGGGHPSVASLEITTIRPLDVSVPPCAVVVCITEAMATPYFGGAEFSFKTSKPATFQLEVREAATLAVVHAQSTIGFSPKTE
jgi:hypothetical protein